MFDLTGKKRAYLKIEFEDKSNRKFINICKQHGLYMWNVSYIGTIYKANIRLVDFYRFMRLCRDYQIKVKVIKKVGLPFLLHKYRKHYSFVAGIFIAISIIWACSLFIWDIDFVGNSKYTDGVLLDYLKINGVYPGIKIKEVDCYGIETAIRNQYNDITWVSVNITGTKLKVCIKENAKNSMVMATNEPCDIIATKDGVIESIVTSKGTPLVKAGDSVTKGQILVSGVVKCLDDAGTHISNIYVASKADINISSTEEYDDSISEMYSKKIYTGKEYNKGVIGITNTDLELGLPYKNFENADIDTDIKALSINKSFVLPIYYGCKKYREYSILDVKYTESEANTELLKHFEQYKKDLLENKVQIESYNVKMYKEGNMYRYKGTVKLLGSFVENTSVTDIKIITDKENEQ